MKTLKTQTDCSFEIAELLAIVEEYGYEPEMTKQDGTFHLAIPLRSEVRTREVNPLRFIELLTWDTRQVAEEEQLTFQANYTKTLVDALLDRIDDLETALTTKSNRIHETRRMLEAKIALINLVEQI